MNQNEEFIITGMMFITMIPIIIFILCKRKEKKKMFGNYNYKFMHQQWR